MLEARELTKAYNGVLVLNKLNFAVNSGEIFCLLGADGAGKTTTINLFLNFVPPMSGQALVNGIDVSKEPLKAKRHIAYIPETVMLYASLSGLENLAYFTTLALGHKRREKELIELLAQAGVAKEVAFQRVSGYSKGMRQKVGDRFASSDNTITLEHYVTADVAVFYRIKQVDLAFNLRNLFDKKYFIAGQGGALGSAGTHMPGASRNAQLAARFHF